MGNIVLDSLRLLISKNLESYSSLGIGSIWIVDVGPNSFNVLRGVKILVHVRVLSIEVKSGVVIVGVSDPHSQNSISVVGISLSGLTCSQSSQEIPGGDLSRPSWSWVKYHESNPESVTIFGKLHRWGISLNFLGEDALTKWRNVEFLISSRSGFDDLRWREQGCSNLLQKGILFVIETWWSWLECTLS